MAGQDGAVNRLGMHEAEHGEQAAEDQARCRASSGVLRAAQRVKPGRAKDVGNQPGGWRPTARGQAGTANSCRGRRRTRSKPGFVVQRPGVAHFFTRCSTASSDVARKSSCARRWREVGGSETGSTPGSVARRRGLFSRPVAIEQPGQEGGGSVRGCGLPIVLWPNWCLVHFIGVSITLSQGCGLFLWIWPGRGRSTGPCQPRQSGNLVSCG